MKSKFAVSRSVRALSAERGAIPALPFPGIHPVGPCLDRLFDKEFVALPRLMACECPKGLKQAAIDEHPRDMEARKFDVEVAACWELQRYGCILLAANPYQIKAKGRAA